MSDQTYLSVNDFMTMIKTLFDFEHLEKISDTLPYAQKPGSVHVYFNNTSRLSDFKTRSTNILKIVLVSNNGEKIMSKYSQVRLNLNQNLSSKYLASDEYKGTRKVVIDLKQKVYSGEWAKEDVLYYPTTLYKPSRQELEIMGLQNLDVRVAKTNVWQTETREEIHEESIKSTEEKETKE